MPLSLQRAEAAKTVEAPKVEAPKAKKKVTAFYDQYSNHFLGQDAKDVAKVLELAGELDKLPGSDTDHLEVHRQEWNDHLTKLHEAGFEVVVTDA